MIKTYISSLLMVALAGALTVRAQESLDDVFAQLDAAQSGAQSAAVVSASPAPASVQAAPAAAMESSGVMKTASGDLFSQAVKAYNKGEYEKAEATFEAVLAEDPYNLKAMEYLKRTARKIASIEVEMQKASRARAFAEVKAAWNQDLQVDMAVVDQGKEKPKTPDELAIEELTARLQNIVIPTLDFRDASIQDVVLFLTETCRRLDPTGKGVNIMLMGMEDAMGMDQNNITISIVDMNLYEALQFIVEMASMKFEIKPRAVTVSPVNWVAEEDMVLKSFDVVPEVGEEMESMAGGGGGGVDDLFGDSTSSSDGGPVDVAEFFSIVEWPEGSSAIYQPNFYKLFVKNTPKNISGVEDILADLEDEAIMKRSQQVEIEAKFIELSEGALEELGFDWTLRDDGTFAGLKFDQSGNNEFFRRGTGYGQTPVADYGFNNDDTIDPGSSGVLYTDPITGFEKIVGSPGQSLFGNGQRNNTTAFELIDAGILTTMGGAPARMLLQNTSSFPFDLAISAMEQEGTADVLSAPKVTTKSGNEAIIRVVENHRYPQDYDVETGQRTAPVVKPQDWEDYGLGVVLKVTPVVDSESNTIDLDLEPTITKFKGYDDYIVGYNSYETGQNTFVAAGDGSTLFARMPFFEERTIQTQVTIADGSTVVMGGLVDEQTETFRDQVPILGDIPYIGRLFRTEGTRTAKKNLTILVRATQVDASGMTRDQRASARANN